METPKTVQQQISTMRNHTPRLSERKKKLFGAAKDDGNGDDGELLNGIKPLDVNKTPKNTKVMESLMSSCKKSARVISFFDTESEEGDTAEEQNPSPSRRSVRLSLKKLNSSELETNFCTSPHKENIPIKTPTSKESQATKQLQKLFNNSMKITPIDTPSIIEETSSDDEEIEKRNSVTINPINKRHREIKGFTGVSPPRKVMKTITPSIESLSISTKSFYSEKNQTPVRNLACHSSCKNVFGKSVSNGSITHSKSKQTPKRSPGIQSNSINRGVRHKVRKRTNILNLNHKHYAPLDINLILNNVRNEKLRKLIKTQREERQQIEKIHNIFRKATNPIALARPLTSLSSLYDSNNHLIDKDLKQNTSFKTCESTYETDPDFSDVECDTKVDEQAGSEGLITHQNEDALSVISEDSSVPAKRKFFKSGRTTIRKEIHLTDNIKATVTASGKIAIVADKKKVKKCMIKRNTGTNEFSDEQATVDAILRNLDDTGFGDIPPIGDANEVQVLSSNDNSNQFLDTVDHPLSLMNEEESSNLMDDIILEYNQDFNEFRKRLPFNTTDPDIIERQHLLLDFLINNNICTEENFNIFIADPDNHKAEAERIVDKLVVLVTNHQNTDFRQRIPYNTTDPEVIQQQHNFLAFLLENNICTEENFDIFIANYSERKAEAAAILAQYTNTFKDQYAENTTDLANNCVRSNLLSHENANLNLSLNKPTHCFENLNLILPEQVLQSPLNFETNTNAVVSEARHSNIVKSNLPEKQNLTDPQQQQKLFPVFYPSVCRPLAQLYTLRKEQKRFWNAGYGSSQYQIDAGQKAFGAHQCKQCGLVYTIHEPEEEKLHRDFHASLHILRFKGWIDEDIVAIYPEWGADGRIIRLTESSPLKRRERLMDILKIVDKELGSSSYMVPTTFVAYLAVRKMQIVGFCLVQPLDKANKYMYINGIDCCTEEQFEVKCGISRIWVSPLHRRFHIGTRLIQAVQLNTIFGEEIPLDKIAFSAPTELGKIFAQKISKTENFLVYQ